MPLFLTPSSGQSTFGMGICARCSKKMWLDELYDDPNYPGLKVCKDDLDELDPYRLAPVPPDPLTLPFTRPDLPIDTTTSTKPGDPGWPYADAVTTTGSDTVTGT